MSLLAACDALVAALTVAGVPASINRAQVNTPGAWVSPQSVTVTTLAGGATADIDVVLVAGDTGDREALKILESLLTKVLALDLEFTGPVDTSYALVLTGPPLPAFRVPVSLDL